MEKQDDLTIVAQLPEQKDLQPGIHEIGNQVIGIEPGIGLIAISTSSINTESSPARTAMEILMDDMQTNIPPLKSQTGRNTSDAPGTSCLQESLENINEYLYEQAASQFETTQSTVTNMTALQYLNGYLSYVTAPDEIFLLFKNNKLIRLSNAISRPLGDKTNYNSEIMYTPVSPGDVFLIAAKDDINTLEEDFIRLTLSRFPENLDMVLRQFNTKISRAGTSRISSIIVCRINQKLKIKKSWIDKLRSR